MNLHEYDLVIINSSAGKDSLAAIYEVCRMADLQKYDRSKIVISHQDLGESEWQGTRELAEKQANHFGLEIHYSKRKDKNGKEETLLEYAERRGKWPSNKQRWCTSDYKRGPGGTVVTKLTKGLGNCSILYVFGFRKQESPARKRKRVLIKNKKLSTRNRKVYEYLPIHKWTTKQVWDVIKSNGLPYHFAYTLGMPRLSCCFCIFSPFDALVIAGKANPELLDKYITVEEKIDHTFRQDTSLKSIKEAIQNGYEPNPVKDWVM